MIISYNMQTSMLVFVFTCIQVVYLNENNPQLQIKQGVLRGTFRKTWRGKTFFAFQGIPYAVPPVGSRRFQPPLPLTSWKGILDATKSHDSCPQRDLIFNNRTIFGNENCLFLNVFTPKILKLQLIPVIVYIHGGGFMADSGNPYLYGPDIMLDKDIVMVTINYRLGALGFLSLEDEILPGNNGLKDQNLALQWVKNNIASFGGNPNKITIFGNSAGGASVYYHLLSPLSNDKLFHAAISSSGIATAPWAIAQKGEAKRNTKRLAEFLNCPTTSSQVILKCLRNVEAYDIIRQDHKFMEFHYDPGIPHKPVIEPKMPGAFITEHPIDIIKSGGFTKVPYMNGITTDEGALKSASIYNNGSLIEQLNKQFDYFGPMVLHYEGNILKKKISKTVRQFYFQDKTIDNNTKVQLTDAVTDALFYFPLRITNQLHAKYTTQPLYFYVFGYKGSVTVSQFYGDPDHDYGVVHCDDLTYLLSNDIFKDYSPTEADVKMNDIMTTLLYNFAATGNPTPEINSIIPSKWEPIRKNEFKYYAIMDPNSVKMRDSLHEERYNFWKDLGVFSELNNIV